MKRKKFKKLNLSTETLRTLNESALKDAEGAATTTEVTRVCTLCTAACTVCIP